MSCASAIKPITPDDLENSFTDAVCSETMISKSARSIRGRYHDKRLPNSAVYVCMHPVSPSLRHPSERVIIHDEEHPPRPIRAKRRSNMRPRETSHDGRRGKNNLYAKPNAAACLPPPMHPCLLSICHPLNVKRHRFLHERIPSILQSPFCARLRTSLPFSVSDGLPALSVACSKKTGVHVSPFLSLSRAFSRWASSSSCLTVVAFENCLANMALVTPSQSCKDSLGSC